MKDITQDQIEIYSAHEMALCKTLDEALESLARRKSELVSDRNKRMAILRCLQKLLCHLHGETNAEVADYLGDDVPF